MREALLRDERYLKQGKTSRDFETILRATGTINRVDLVRFDNDETALDAQRAMTGTNAALADFGAWGERSFRDVQWMLRRRAVANEYVLRPNKDDRTAIVSLGRE